MSILFKIIYGLWVVFYGIDIILVGLVAIPFVQFFFWIFVAWKFFAAIICSDWLHWSHFLSYSLVFGFMFLFAMYCNPSKNKFNRLVKKKN